MGNPNLVLFKSQLGNQTRCNMVSEGFLVGRGGSWSATAHGIAKRHNLVNKSSSGGFVGKILPETEQKDSEIY